MSGARHDYPILALRAGHRGGALYQERVQLNKVLDELDRLRAWKAEAMTVLGEWEQVWVRAGKPGPLGASKAEAVLGVFKAAANER